MQRPRLWSALRPALYRLLGYKRAVAMADAIADMTGRQAFDYVSGVVGIQTRAEGTENIPRSGGLMIIGNHPTGLADGLFVHNVLQSIRPEYMFLANADALRVVPKAGDLIIPVEWVADKRTKAKTKQTLLEMKAAVADKRTMVIFPSGRLAVLGVRGLQDQEWMNTAVSFAKKYNIPVVPLHIKAKNSLLFYMFSWLHRELKDITLFHEMLNKGRQRPRLRFGPVIDPHSLRGNNDNSTAQMRAIVEKLGRN
ncbi:GNAT family N-acetyltransferase [Robiginitomaculum antarcticum]|uniref:GNAT family N-acetyltransferase n=1 Tax=Robiginitomaculum antarcticum TaxID=437507 RepID=UPI0012EA9533|nr:1-acyl-sn-glycerol-3-phosphate acyltransferase [Robiginitomaculum antarcticum]